MIPDQADATTILWNRKRLHRSDTVEPPDARLDVRCARPTGLAVEAQGCYVEVARQEPHNIVSADVHSSIRGVRQRLAEKEQAAASRKVRGHSEPTPARVVSLSRGLDRTPKHVSH